MWVCVCVWCEYVEINQSDDDIISVHEMCVTVRLCSTITSTITLHTTTITEVSWVTITVYMCVFVGVC